MQSSFFKEIKKKKKFQKRNLMRNKTFEIFN